MPLLFAPIDLFGGAFKTSLPNQFRDVSDYFPIQDNQEVFQDKEHPDVVFTVEILEHESAVPNSSAGQFFLEDAVTTEKNCTAGLQKVYEMDILKDMPELGCVDHPPSVLYPSEKIVGTPLRCEYACQVRGKKITNGSLQSSLEEEKCDSDVRLVLLRFPDTISTDIVISLFVPENLEKASFTSRDEVEVVWQNAIESFRILQWNLFG